MAKTTVKARRVRTPRVRTVRATSTPHTIRIPMHTLKEMKRQAYAMGNFKEISRIDKIIRFYNGMKK